MGFGDRVTLFFFFEKMVIGVIYVELVGSEDLAKKTRCTSFTATCFPEGGVGPLIKQQPPCSK